MNFYKLFFKKKQTKTLEKIFNTESDYQLDLINAEIFASKIHLFQPINNRRATGTGSVQNTVRRSKNFDELSQTENKNKTPVRSCTVVIRDHDIQRWL